MSRSETPKPIERHHRCPEIKGQQTRVIKIRLCVPSTLDRFAPKIAWRDPNDLVPGDRNARTHTEKQIAQLAASITQFGFVNPSW